MMEAASRGQVHMSETLLEHGAEVNARDKLGRAQRQSKHVVSGRDSVGQAAITRG